eukprot:jgi/Hompol1/2127/HPOL_005866-RA
MLRVLSLASVLALAGFMAPLVAGDPNVSPPPTVPILAKFDQVEDGFSPSGCVFLYWSVVDSGKANETLHAALVFNATAHFANGAGATDAEQRASGGLVWNAWVGIGWGSSMLTSDSLLAWANPYSRSVIAVETIPSQSYSPPVESSNKIMKILSTGVFDNCIVVEFSRPTKSDSIHASIDVNTLVSHIWAYNPAPDPNADGGWKSHHGSHRGGYKIAYASGLAYSINPDSIEAKRFHGLGMAITWLGIFPTSVYYTKFFRSIPGWLLVHQIIQVVGSIFGMLVCAIYIIVNVNPATNFIGGATLSLMARPHSILGITIVCATFVQGSLGVFQRYALAREDFNDNSTRHKYVRFVHVWLGRIILLTAFAQAGLGIQVLYPLSEVKFRGREAWIAYIFVVIFWFSLFTVSTVLFEYSAANPSYKLVLDDSGKKTFKQSPQSGIHILLPHKKGSDSAHVLSDEGNNLMGPSAVAFEAASKSHANLRSFTWEDINQSVTNGRLLVVADGKYVFDINNWIFSHPGGQVILHAVAGTDITNDYFHEAGFDSETFIPKQQLNRLLGSFERTLLKEFTASDRSSVAGSERPIRPPSTISIRPNAAAEGLDPIEWSHVLRARRTHVHTRLAIARL